MASAGGNEFHGKGETLHDAVQDAWKKAPKNGGGETAFEVVRIHVHGNNPLTGYSVILAPTG